MQDKILPGIVLYKPNVAILKETLESIAPISKRIVVVLNSTYEHSVGKLMKDLNLDPIYIGDGTNLGIGWAHNEIMRVATKLNYDFALICDQDSIFPNNISDILEGFQKGNNVCAVAPAWSTVSIGQKKLALHSIWKNGNWMKISRIQSDFIKITHCISSGMIISTRDFKDVGPFREDLFIDWVDNEWCWRAHKKGFSIMGSGKVTMAHRMGDDLVNMKITQFTKRNQRRNYFIVRNAVYLVIFGKLFYPQRFYLIKKILHHICLSLVLEDYRLRQLRNYSDAIFHGLMKKLN